MADQLQQRGGGGETRRAEMNRQKRRALRPDWNRGRADEDSGVSRENEPARGGGHSRWRADSARERRRDSVFFGESGQGRGGRRRGKKDQRPPAHGHRALGLEDPQPGEKGGGATQTQNQKERQNDPSRGRKQAGTAREPRVRSPREGGDHRGGPRRSSDEEVHRDLPGPGRRLQKRKAVVADIGSRRGIRSAGGTKSLSLDATVAPSLLPKLLEAPLGGFVRAPDLPPSPGRGWG